MLDTPLDPYIVEAVLLHYADEKFDDPYWYTWFDRDRTNEIHEIPGLGEIKVAACNLVKDVSYAEHSEIIWMVFEVAGAFYKKEGKHMSYSGTEWIPGMRIVVPKEKVITVFEEETANV